MRRTASSCVFAFILALPGFAAGEEPTPGDGDDERPEDLGLQDEAEPLPRTRHEEPGVTYRSIGLAYRHGFVPAGMIEAFVRDAPRGIRVPQVALEYARRIDGVEVTASLTYQDFGFAGAFRNDDDTRFEYEWLDSNLRSIGIGASVSWSSDFSDVFAIEGGLDFGLGGLFGRVRRTEAYPSLGQNSDADGGFAPCVGPSTAGSAGTDDPIGADFDPSRFGDTGGVTAYCGRPLNGQLTDPDIENGEQYGVAYHNWAQGGKMPFLSWRLAPRLSFRFKVHPQFVLRLDSGFDLGSGFIVGMAGHYVF